MVSEWRAEGEGFKGRMEWKDFPCRPQRASFQRNYTWKATEAPKTYCLKHVGLVHLKCLRCRLSKLKCDFISLVENQMEHLTNNWETDFSSRSPMPYSTPFGSTVCFPPNDDGSPTPCPRFSCPPNNTFSSPQLQPPSETPRKSSTPAVRQTRSNPNDTVSPEREPEKPTKTSISRGVGPGDKVEQESQFPSATASITSVKSDKPRTAPSQLLLMSPPFPSHESVILPSEIPSGSTPNFQKLSTKSEVVTPPRVSRTVVEPPPEPIIQEPEPIVHEPEPVDETPQPSRRPSNLVQPGDRRSPSKKSVRIAEMPAIELDEELSQESSDIPSRYHSEDFRSSHRSQPVNQRWSSSHSVQTRPLEHTNCTMVLLKNLLRVFLFFALVYLAALIAFNGGFMLFKAFQDKCTCWQQHRKIIF